MKLSAVVFITTLYLFGLSGQTYATFEEDYYWRDYRGTIPSDALKAGENENGQSIYVGQVVHQDKLIPGTIYSDDSNIYYEFVDAFAKNVTVKILCTQHPEKFQWIPVMWREVGELEDKNLFEGGYEEGYSTYVARGKTDGKIGVGKVVCSPYLTETTGSFCYRLTTVHEGKWDDHNQYEILAYSSEITKDINLV